MSEAADFEADAVVFVQSQNVRPDVFMAHDPIMIVKLPDTDHPGLSGLVEGFIRHLTFLFAPLERLATVAEQMLQRQMERPGISGETGVAATSGSEETRGERQLQPRQEERRLPGDGEAVSTPRESDAQPGLRSDQLAKLEDQVAEIRDLLKRQVVSTGATKDWYSVNEVADHTGH